MAGKVNPNAPRKLTDFKLLSFDVYSTLIDEKGGLFTHLHPLLSRLADPQKFQYLNNRAFTLEKFQAHEHRLQKEKPHLSYPEILRLAYLSFDHEIFDRHGSLMTTLNLEAEAQHLSQSIPSWPAFPDTVTALHKLHQYYKLAILSNIDEISILGTIKNNMDIGWDAIYTAQTIGSYKPDLRNFEYLVKHAEDDLGVQKEEILHTAQRLIAGFWGYDGLDPNTNDNLGLRADHVPVKKMNMNGVWIDRDDEGQDYEKLKDEVAHAWKFSTLGEMADAVEKAFEAEGKKV